MKEIRKIKSIHHFSNKYTDKGVLKLATVVLEINHEFKYYDINPYGNKKEFKFIKASGNWRLWKAVTQCINDAIDFANKELEL